MAIEEVVVVEAVSVGSGAVERVVKEISVAPGRAIELSSFAAGGGGGPLVGGGGGGRALVFAEGTDKLEGGVGLVTVRVVRESRSGFVKGVLGEF